MNEEIEKLNPEELVQFNKKSIQNAFFLIETKINEIIDTINAMVEESDQDLDDDDEDDEIPVKLSDLNPAKPPKKK